MEKMNENLPAVLKGLPENIVAELKKVFLGLTEMHNRMMGAVTLADLLEK